MSFSFLLAGIPAPFDFADIFRNIGSRWYVYVVVGVARLLLLTYFILKKHKRNTLSYTQKIVYTAILCALSFVANYFTIKVSDLFQISLVATVAFISGFIMGSCWGFVAAFLGDFICGIVAPLGVYSPLIGLGNGLFAFIPGLIFERFNWNDDLKVLISFVASFIIVSFAVNTLGLALLYGFNFEDLFVQLPVKFLSHLLNGIVCLLIVPVLKRVLPKDKFSVATEKGKK